MAARAITEAQIRKRIKSACEGAQKAGLHVLGVEVGEDGLIRLTTSSEAVDATLQTVSHRQPDTLDKWANQNVVSLETHQQ